jgi:hypothetical protein
MVLKPYVAAEPIVFVVAVRECGRFGRRNLKE